MKFGVSIFPTHFSAPIAGLAIEAERLKFESLFVSEHSHIPINTEFPLGDGQVPLAYKSMLDPFVALSAAASVTKKIKLGTAICILPQHNPINCAKAVTSIDHVSGGRMVFGVGAGWNPPEMENHGVRFENRFKVTRERIELMKRLWTEDEAEFKGEMESLTPSWQLPKPVQKPHPPILVAGSGPNILKRVVALGDGWMPVFAMEWHPSLEGKQTRLDELPKYVAELCDRAGAAGKSNPTISAMGLPPTPEYIDLLEENGVERMVLFLPHDNPQEAFDQLNSYADHIASY